MENKFRYVLFPDNIYKVVVDDYDGNPYMFEISGREIISHIRREALLEKQFSEIDEAVWARPLDIISDDDIIEP